jgi:hypothetical protein
MCACTGEERFPAGELQPLYPLGALCLAAIVRLSQALLWHLQWHQLSRLDQFEGVSQPSHPFASVFQGLAARGKTSVDWFFGFKLHLVVNDQGDLLNIMLTPGNTDDRKPVPDWLKALFGKVFADRGYGSQALFEQLLRTCGIELFAKPKRNMKPRLMRLTDKLLARKRAIIESVIDQLKNISQIEHSRHRSPVNFCVNVLCGLMAYCHQPKKPALNLDDLFA